MFARYLELALYRANAEIKRDASRAYLGILWWLIEPILYMSVFYLIFGLGLRRGGSDFVVYLLSGLIVWKWLDGSVKSAANSIATSVGLMQQVYLPKAVLPAVVVIVNAYKFLIVFGMFLLFLTIFWRVGPTIHWQYLPILALIQLLLICALAGLAAAVVPIVPDLKYVIEYALALGFFVSGIFFDVHEMTPEIQDILHNNPMLVIIEAYRDILLYGREPDWSSLLKVTIASLGLFLVMVVMLRKLDRYYPRVVT